MILFSTLRFLVYAKRAVSHLASIDESLRSIAATYAAEWEAKNAPKVARKQEIGTFDRAKASHDWEKEMAERGILRP